MFKFFIIILLLNGCGKFNYSPYISNTKDVHHNSKGVSDIAARSGEFSNTYKIALLSDSHDYYKELRKNIEFINKNKSVYAFVIITGDMTNIGLLSEYETAKKYYDMLDVPYVVTVGNHDLLTNGESIFEQMFGEDTFSFEFKQTKFILYNNNNWESSYLVPDLDWVESELSSSAKTHNILLSHVASDDKARFSDKKQNELKNLVNTHNVKYVINGHDHNPGDGVFGVATQLTIGSSSKKVFSELIISDASVTHAFVRP
jgi:predicted phosphodiesterase